MQRIFPAAQISITVARVIPSGQADDVIPYHIAACARLISVAHDKRVRGVCFRENSAVCIQHPKRRLPPLCLLQSVKESSSSRFAL